MSRFYVIPSYRVRAILRAIEGPQAWLLESLAGVGVELEETMKSDVYSTFEALERLHRLFRRSVLICLVLGLVLIARYWHA